ncbi:MAG: AAA family ATPase [Desulfovibrionaceae bacterium]
MEYYERLGLAREPFSNSPDPDFLFYSRQHIDCLQQMEIAVRLRRGLNVVVGPVGTGKTTLIRRLIKDMGADRSVRLHLVLDPYFKSAHAFLRMLCSQVLGTLPDRRLNAYSLKEQLKRELFRRGVEENLLSVLVVDEAQKMTPECLEVLRELLNYETNNRKLLQILLFAQPEIEPVIRSMENFMDRVNTFVRLKPLSLREARAMIDYRLEMASDEHRGVPRLFTPAGVRVLHKAAGGYPRKLVRLCHKAMLALLIQKRRRVSWSLARTVVLEETDRAARFPIALAGAVAACVVVAGLWAVRAVPEVRRLAGGIESAVASTVEHVSGVADRYSAMDASPAKAVEHPGTDPGIAPVAVSDYAGNPALVADYHMAERMAFDEAAALAGEDAPGLDPDVEPLDAELEPVAAAAMAPAEARLPEAPASTQVTPAPKSPASNRPASWTPGLAPDPAEDAALAGAFAVPALPAGLEPAASADGTKLPALLGAVPVMPDDTFSSMVRKVYGAYDRDNAARVLAANPALGNINALEVGDLVNFPVIRPSAEGAGAAVRGGLVWLRLAVERDLALAYGRMRAAGHFGLPARILPYVTAEGPLAFAVVLERPFAGRALAEAEREKLPLSLQKTAAAMDSPAEGACLAQMNELAWDVLRADLAAPMGE